MIDGNPVVVEFTEDEARVIVGTNSEQWKAYHVWQSQYFLQIVKCADPKYCSSFQSSCLKDVLKRLLKDSSHHPSKGAVVCDCVSRDRVGLDG